MNKRGGKIFKLLHMFEKHNVYIIGRQKNTTLVTGCLDTNRMTETIIKKQK